MVRSGEIYLPDLQVATPITSHSREEACDLVCLVVGTLILLDQVSYLYKRG